MHVIYCEHNAFEARYTNTMSYFQGDSIFWIEVEKIRPNPHQPRKEFDQEKLRSLADSIRQYGVLQPLVVTRREVEKPDGGIAAEYELIAGERRLRASKIAQLIQVPVIIKSGEEDALLKLELAIIENVQREDLNPIDRAIAFNRLAAEFGFKHGEIGKKIGKSREYVSNTLRLLGLPEEIKNAVAELTISEGHGRTLMMLSDRPEEQSTLFKEIVYKNLTVRETESIARKIAHDKVRKKERAFDPEIVEFEDKLSESLGTRVQIERRDNGGKIMIDFFSNDDIKNILAIVSATAADRTLDRNEMLNNFIASRQASQAASEERPEDVEYQNTLARDSENGLTPEEQATAPTPESEPAYIPSEAVGQETENPRIGMMHEASTETGSASDESNTDMNEEHSTATESNEAATPFGDNQVESDAVTSENTEEVVPSEETVEGEVGEEGKETEEDDSLYSVSQFTI